MDKITFVNGQAPAINSNNLNQIQSNVESALTLLQSTIQNSLDTLQTSITALQTNTETIFENTDGISSGTITLTKELSNYKYIEIFGKHVGDTSSSEIYCKKIVGDGITIITVTGDTFDDWVLYTHAVKLTKTDNTTLSILNNYGYKLQYNNGVDFNVWGENNLITKIIGHKE